MNVYDFIKDGLNKFDCDSLYTLDVQKICLDLNNVLNNVPTDKNYSEYLEDENTSSEIEKLYKKLFLELNNSLYVDLSDILLLLKDFQLNRKIKNKYYRDHFYHSIQCFLLGLSLYKTIAAASPANQNSDVLIIIFSICMYHDLGYLYFVAGNNMPCINDDMKSRFNCGSNWDKAMKLKELLVFTNVKTERLIQCTSSCELLNIWEEDINFADNDFLRNLANVQFGKEYNTHHSYESAVLLSRILRSKQRIIQELNKSILEDAIFTASSNDSNDTLFKEIIRVILFHDYNMNSLLSLTENFWDCFLMLIDEMQNYGRTYQDENLNLKVLSPALTGFEISNNKINLWTDTLLAGQLKKSYSCHSNQAVINKLKNKMNIQELERIFLSEYAK